MVATVIVGMLCAHLLCFSVMFMLISRRLQGGQLGMHVFAAGNLMLGCAYVLQLLGGPPSAGAVSVLNHTLTLAAPVAFGLGGGRFFGRPWPVWQPLLAFVLAYTALQCGVQAVWGLQARYAMLSGTSAVLFLVMALTALWGARTFARDLVVEMLWFAALIAGICVLNALKLWQVLDGGLQALSMGSRFQTVFYIYMSFLATVLAPSIVWLVLRRLTDALRSLAGRDELTQLLNRRGLDDALQAYFRARKAQPAYLLMADIDFFKRVNDVYGHAVGDAVLRQVAQAIRGTVREGDWVCRFGGEEFVAVCVDTDARGAAQLAERIREAVATLDMEAKGLPAPMRCTLTVGVSHGFWGAQALDTAMQEADEALYRGKAAGRNRVEVAAGPAPALAPVGLVAQGAQPPSGAASEAATEVRNVEAK